MKKNRVSFVKTNLFCKAVVLYFFNHFCKKCCEKKT